MNLRGSCLFVTCLLVSTASVAALSNGVGLKPALGWSSWNAFANDVSESTVLATADLFISTGLKDAGFEYLNIDAGYLLHDRDSAGKLQINSTKFPHGMKWLSDQIHAKGLKLGVYTDLTSRSCGIGPGSLDHYTTDADTFANEWQVDYLKVDYCGPSIVSPEPVNQYNHWAALRDALNATGRPVYYSICPHTNALNMSTGVAFHGRLVYSPPIVWTAEQRHELSNAQLVEFENTFDMWYESSASGPRGLLTNIDSLVLMTNLSYSQKGSWNDADMLQVCNYGKGHTIHSTTGMTLSEYRIHFAVWSIVASPLILGFDLEEVAKNHQDCLDMVLNKEIIGVNQDDGAFPGFLVSQVTNSTEVTSATITQQVFARKLQSSCVAVAVINRGEADALIPIQSANLGLPSTTSISLRDLFAKRDIGTFTGTYTAKVPRHDVVMLKLCATTTNSDA